MASPPGRVDAERMKAAASEPGNWLAGGRDQQGTYYSPLTRINSRNVGGLGFAWSYDLGKRMSTTSTPI
jgi:quinohemoprotein ethanol dehydrogenase